MAKEVTRFACDECGGVYRTAPEADQCAQDNRATKKAEQMAERFELLCDHINWRCTDAFLDEFAALVAKHAGEPVPTPGGGR